LEDIKASKKGLEKIITILSSGKHNVVIMEEANVAVKIGLLSVQDILKIMTSKPQDVELVITGRSADSKIIEKADLVTEMKEIKHYFQKGVAARVGIEK
jgi:cob(I)alamin adenosyltransferase